MRGLTKEEFWNKALEDYPLAMEKFCKWIDKYKEENNWDSLFNQYNRYIEECGVDEVINLVSPKFHDLPLAMQIGIFQEFLYSLDKNKLNEVDTREYFKEYLKDRLKEVNN